MGISLLKVHCGAHRYELVVKRAFKKNVPNNALFESSVNRFATFYNVVNHKVMMILLSMMPLLFLRRFSCIFKEMGTPCHDGRRIGHKETLEAFETFSSQVGDQQFTCSTSKLLKLVHINATLKK